MKIVLLKECRPADVDGKEQPAVEPGTEIDLPNDEAQRALDLGIALTVDDAKLNPSELEAINMLKMLDYTVTPPEAPKPAKTKNA